MREKGSPQKQSSAAPSRAASKENTGNVLAPIPPNTFYGTDNKTSNGSKTPPHLPKRKSTAGSAHSKFFPPRSTSPSTFREPELVKDDTLQQSSSLIPEHVSSSAVWPDNNDFPENSWARDYTPSINPSWNSPSDAFPWTAETHRDVEISGRNENEENIWWDRSDGVPLRPGPGMLPPRLADSVHNAEHSLYGVSVTFPDIRQSSSSAPAPARHGSPHRSSPAPSTLAASSSFVPPSSQEIHEAVPHPNAYYCRRHNGWVLLSWKTSSIANLQPLLAKSFDATKLQLLSQNRRHGAVCVGEHPVDSRRPNRTHHFHLYRDAVEARYLSPSFQRKSWERKTRERESRRRVTISADDNGRNSMLFNGTGDTTMQLNPDLVDETLEADSDVDLLDLYVCCQCPLAVFVSDTLPGVIPAKYVDEFTQERARFPMPEKTPEQSAIVGWETILNIIENKLWKGNNKALSIPGRSFNLKVGWNTTVQKLFEALGFTIKTGSSPDDQLLTPPATDSTSVEGRMNRQRLLRAWVEISAYLFDYERRFPKALLNHVAHPIWIKLTNVREMYESQIGAHHDQIPRGSLHESIYSMLSLEDAWKSLGITRSTCESSLLQFAYLAQIRCDPQNTLEYFSNLVRIVDAMTFHDNCPIELSTFVATERSRNRFTYGELEEATRKLGFGLDNDLKVEFEEDVPDHFIERAWRDAIRRSWQDSNGDQRRRALNEAFRMVAESRGSREMWNHWDMEQNHGMTPEKAYQTLEVPQGVDEDMLITIYNMRVEDQPAQVDKMAQALRVIAAFTYSDRLTRFVDSGSDPGAVVAPTRPDWPRGLNQLGNTCYLNSLLQYFYTIKDLRDAVAPLALITDKVIDEDKLKDDDLKNHRVGGRMVTRREVVRSRKFVSQLANLFYQLEHSDTPAVTPTIELAKLALVTSKDEEEDDFERGATDSSHSTDATLVDETTQPAIDSPSTPPKLESPPPVAATPSSILGKRTRALLRKKHDHFVAEPESVVFDEEGEKDFILVSKVSSDSATGSTTSVSTVVAPTPSTVAVTVTDYSQDKDGDILMADSAEGSHSAGTTSSQSTTKAPPLPPRPKSQSTTSGSDMMFGKQHDVAECMDNCMFQIETALLRFGELAGSDVNKRSIVKKLFYGKIRQRLSVQSVESSRSKSSMHEREDFFSHLPVNVSEESFDLYDGLSGYFDDIVEFEGKKARMEVSLVELPPIMQIQLQRVQFNKETMQPYKSHAYVKFGESICLDRFLDDAPAEKKAKSKAIQEELNFVRDRIYVLTQTKHAPYAESLEKSVAFLTSQIELELPEADEGLLVELKAEKERVTAELEQCRARVSALKQELEDVWRDETRAEYELTSVFVHRGSSPSFGHYFIYQRWLPNYPESWFKYNDSDVTIVPKDEVLADTTGSIANPYLLVFARKGAEVIHTVQRVDAMVTEEGLL